MATIARYQQPVAFERSLAALHPELLAEWHPTRNGDRDPRTIAPGTDRRIWWRCAACGHEWAAAGSDRTSTRREPHGCPACARARQRQAMLAVACREQSFGAQHPDLVAEWHPTRNGIWTLSAVCSRSQLLSGYLDRGTADAGSPGDIAGGRCWWRSARPPRVAVKYGSILR